MPGNRLVGHQLRGIQQAHQRRRIAQQRQLAVIVRLPGQRHLAVREIRHGGIGLSQHLIRQTAIAEYIGGHLIAHADRRLQRAVEILHRPGRLPRAQIGQAAKQVSGGIVRMRRDRRCEFRRRRVILPARHQGARMGEMPEHVMRIDRQRPVRQRQRLGDVLMRHHVLRMLDIAAGNAAAARVQRVAVIGSCRRGLQREKRKQRRPPGQPANWDRHQNLPGRPHCVSRRHVRLPTRPSDDIL
jgi:hypothetical protein